MRTSTATLGVVLVLTTVDLRAQEVPAHTRLFFAPTARSEPRGRGSVAVTEIAFPSAEVGLSNRMSLRAFAVPPLATDGLVVLGPKLQILRHSRMQAAVGTFQAFGSGYTGGIAFGVVTVGGEGGGVTFGYGYGYGDAADSEGSPGVVIAGADMALGRRWRVLVEGYVGGAGLGLPEETIMGGVRFSAGQWSVDLGAVLPIYGSKTGPPVPLVTVGWAF